MQKSVDAREGALSAVECLTYKLGRWALLQLLTNTYTAVQVSVLVIRWKIDVIILHLVCNIPFLAHQMPALVTCFHSMLLHLQYIDALCKF